MQKDFLALRKELKRLQPDQPDVLALLERILAQAESDRQESDRRLARLADNLRTLDSRILTLENSRIFRALHRAAAAFRSWKFQSTKYVTPGLSSANQARVYELWLEKEALRTPPAQWFRDASRQLRYQPRFSLLLHVDRPDRDKLRACVDAVIGQSYPEWELCVCDDASPEPWIAPFFHSLGAADRRVQYVRSAEPLGAASSLNRAGILSAGDYVAAHGQHDVLSPHALYYFAEALQAHRHDLLYGDHDRLARNGARVDPCFKPGWSPDLLVGSAYPGAPFIVERAVLTRAGWFRGEFDGACQFDLALRLAESRPSVGHVPRVLSSIATDPPDPKEEKRALEDSLRRRGREATVEENPERTGFRLRHKLNGAPLVSIIICSRRASLLWNCLQKLDSATAYPVREIVVVQHKTGDDAAMDKLLAHSHCVRVSHVGPFDFASMNNRGARAASGQFLVFLNDDVEPLSADWLNILLSQVQRPEVGMAGPRLLYPTGAIQHAGIAIGIMDGTGHPHRGAFHTGFRPWSATARNVSAVTGACLAMRRGVFEELGGFDPMFPVNYNDVDLCLRARQLGYEVIYEPDALLRHYESRTRVRGITWEERELWFERWGRAIEQGDPFYSPNLTKSAEDCSLQHG